MKILPLLTASLIAMVAASSAHAAVIVQYTFAGSSLSPTDEAANVDGGNFVFGAGLGSPTISTSTGNPLPSIFVSSDRTGEPVSPTSTDYVGFSVTAQSGFLLDLTTLSFDYAYSGGDNSQSATFTIRSSVDGFASNLASFTELRQSTVSFKTTDPAVALPSLSFSGLSSVEFRIYLTDTTSSSTSYLRMDNVTLQGSVVAVPEPGAGVLLMAGLMILGIRRVRHNRAA